MEERSENASGTVGSNVRNIFEPPSRWYSKDERPYAQRRAKLTSLRAPNYPHREVPRAARVQAARSLNRAAQRQGDSEARRCDPAGSTHGKAEPHLSQKLGGSAGAKPII